MIYMGGKCWLQRLTREAVRDQNLRQLMAIRLGASLHCVRLFRLSLVWQMPYFLGSCYWVFQYAGFVGLFKWTSTLGRAFPNTHSALSGCVIPWTRTYHFRSRAMLRRALEAADVDI